MAISNVKEKIHFFIFNILEAIEIVIEITIEFKKMLYFRVKKDEVYFRRYY